MAITVAMSRTIEIEDFHYSTSRNMRNYVAEPQGGYILSIYKVEHTPQQQGDCFTISVKYRYIDPDNNVWVVRKCWLDSESNLCLSKPEFDLHLP